MTHLVDARVLWQSISTWITGSVLDYFLASHLKFELHFPMLHQKYKKVETCRQMLEVGHGHAVRLDRPGKKAISQLWDRRPTMRYDPTRRGISTLQRIL